MPAAMRGAYEGPPLDDSVQVVNQRVSAPEGVRHVPAVVPTNDEQSTPSIVHVQATPSKSSASVAHVEATPSKSHIKVSQDHFERVKSYPKAKKVDGGAGAVVETAAGLRDPRRDPEAAFVMFDTDRDGRLALDDVVTLVRSHGCLAGIARLRELFSHADTTRGGTVTYAEYTSVFGPRGELAMVGIPPPDRCVDAFAALDPDGSGRLSADELAYLCRAHGGADSMDDATVRELLAELKIDEQKGLDYALLAREVGVS